MQPTLSQLTFYFLRLGSMGFGGPIALCAQMHVELVEKRGWFSRQEYDEGFAFSQTAPGPVAFQLAIYLAFLRFGVLGATLTGIAFMITPFLLVLLLSLLYVRYGGLGRIEAVLLGVSPAVVAIVIHATFQLGRNMLRSWSGWVVAVLSFCLAALLHFDLSLIIIGAGLAGLLYALRPIFHPMWVLVVPPSAQAGAHHAGSLQSLLPDLGWFFFKAGALTFGSGYVVIAFVQQGVVDTYHWLTVREFLDGVAFGQITPGPVVITSAFVGYLVEGIDGAIVSTLAVVLPVYLITIFGAPFVNRYRTSRLLQGFMVNANAAAIGVIASVAVSMGVSAVTDWKTAAILFASLLVLFLKNVPTVVLIVVAAVIGALIM